MKRTIERLRAEFSEMPGLRLTPSQVQRLCGLDETTCRAVLDALVDIQFLRVNADGTYARVTDGPMVRLVAARADTTRPSVRQAS